LTSQNIILGPTGKTDLFETLRETLECSMWEMKMNFMSKSFMKKHSAHYGQNMC